MSRLSSGDEYQAPRGGLILLYCLIMFLFCVFALRFWYLQVHKSEYYADKARENRLRQDAVYAPRGLIRDVHGELIAVNEPAYALGLIRDECRDISGTLEQVAEWSGVPLEKIKADYAKGKRRLKPFEPIILVSNLSFELLSVVEAHLQNWPGLAIIMRPDRKYRYGTLMAHIIGYVAEADEEEIDKDEELSMGDLVGKQGIELMQEKRLRGVKGSRQTEVDATGRRLEEAVIKTPEAGGDVELSIDLKIQQLGMDQFHNKTGSVVVMDADTGRLLALVSSPSYDSNTFVGGLSNEEWVKLRDDPRHPMQHRAIQSVYPPGSVFKLVMAGAGLSNNMINLKEKIHCPGFTKLGSHVFRCWRRGGHGAVALETALVQSCDVYFYKLGERLKVDRISEFAFKGGFGNRTGIELPHENPGLIPTRKWKRKRFGERWQGGENLNLAIGQGYTLVTPLQVARYIAAVINGGKLLKPLLLNDEEPVVQGTLPLTQEQLGIIKEAMVQTVDNPRGTARRLRQRGAVVGGKTGTAQVVRLTDKLKNMKDHEIPYKFRDHAWMSSFGEKDGKKYVVVAMVEHGLHGSSGAGPVCKAIYDYVFRKDEKDGGKSKKSKAVPARPAPAALNRTDQPQGN